LTQSLSLREGGAGSQLQALPGCPSPGRRRLTQERAGDPRQEVDQGVALRLVPEVVGRAPLPDGGPVDDLGHVRALVHHVDEEDGALLGGAPDDVDVREGPGEALGARRCLLRGRAGGREPGGLGLDHHDDVGRVRSGRGLVVVWSGAVLLPALCLNLKARPASLASVAGPSRSISGRQRPSIVFPRTSRPAGSAAWSRTRYLMPSSSGA